MMPVPDTVRQLRAGMREAGLDAVMATTPDNVTYVAGFTVPSHLTNRFRRTLCLLPLEGDPALVVVAVEETLAHDRTRWIQEIHAYNEFTEDPFAVLAQLIRDRGLDAGRVGIEMDHVAADDYLRLLRHLPAVRFVHAGPVFLEARTHKTPAEVQAIRALARLAARAHGEAYEHLRPGMSERDLARLLIDACPGVDYCRPIVGSGERSAFANAAPTDRRIEAGDVIRVDLIAGQKWFHSDGGAGPRLEHSHRRVSARARPPQTGRQYPRSASHLPCEPACRRAGGEPEVPGARARAHHP
jgi:Xaa-Pro dipeptidase